MEPWYACFHLKTRCVTIANKQVGGRIKLQPDFVAFKTSGSDDILRIDKGTVMAAQWSRAARGYMLKLLTETNVYKFCGFQESVS